MKTSTSMLGVALALVIIPATLAQFFDPTSGALQPPPLPQVHAITFPSGFDVSSSGANLAVNPAVNPAMFAQPAKAQLAHHAVLRNAADEERLPGELRNDFYKNPRLAEALAKESWFTPGEEQVIEREAEKIPRDRVVKLLKNAGLARRRR